MVNGTESLKHA